MNSKILQDRIQEIKDSDIEMRLLRRSDKNQDLDGKEKSCVSTSNLTVSLKHYDQLLCDLKCPGCTGHLQAPIYLCMKGHSICRLCRVSMKCPVCDSELSNIRSCTLERLSGKFQFPCKNLRNGCHVRLPLELMKWHEEKCIYKKTSCFMGKIWHDCVWRGRENEWLQHCKNKHSSKIIQKHEFELTWNFETLKNNAGPIIAYYLITTYNETFNLYQIHESKPETLTWTIILADYKCDAGHSIESHQSDLPKFSFEFEFYNKKDPRYLLIERFPVHYEDSEDVLDDGKCVKVCLNDVKRFLDEDQNLFYRVKIISEKKRKDRWDQILEKTIQHHPVDPFEKNGDFAFFDSNEDDDRVYMNDEKLVVIRRDEDTLKQIFEKEFSPVLGPQETKQMVQKPPRKSIENRRSYESLNRKRHSGSYSSSRNSMGFDD